jgi:hypothetical protein
MGVKPKVNYLYTSLQDCLVIFQLYDIIKPSCVNMSRVVQNFSPKKAKFEKLGVFYAKNTLDIFISKINSIFYIFIKKNQDNCNYAIEIGKKEMNFKLVGIQGSNLLDGHKTYTLGIKKKTNYFIFN